MTRLPLYVAVTLGLCVGARPLGAQTGSVEGTVTAAATNEPVAGAEVTVAGTNIGVRTGPDGRFTLGNIAAGLRELRILAIGYRIATLRLTIRADQVTHANAQLTPSVLQLHAVMVTWTGGVGPGRQGGHPV